MGLPTTAWFQYGTSSTAYSKNSPVKSIGNSLDETPFSDRINGLLAGTTYYYRLAAQNSEGATYGSEMIFTTEVPGGKISGYVVNSLSGEPVESVRLRLKGTRARKKTFRVLFSDEKGFFTFNDLDADTYTISARKTDFKSTRHTIVLEESEEKGLKFN